MTIIAGQLTYDAEGTEGGRFHSRQLHVPSKTSGLTIGRGYDMKEKSGEQIEKDLINAGVFVKDARLLARAAGLSGKGASQFIADLQLESFEISTKTQQALFTFTYDVMAQDVRRICNKPDCVAAYGAVDWDNLDPYIKDVLIDLRYRGDYTPTSRRRIQQLVASNDVPQFSEDLSNRENWSSVPEDRFARRVDFLEGHVI
ncbi:MAG: hypothetical protein HRT35_29100 [Algicola sp.]|nr:hypothetical protein [Algicola sp.]